MTAQRGVRLISVIAHARAGSLNRAWSLLQDIELGGEGEDPSLLNVKARLLKDEAIRASAGERRRL